MIRKSTLTSDEWLSTFSGYTTKGCALREKGFYYVLLEALPSTHDGGRRPEHGGEDRLAIYIAEDAPTSWGHSVLVGFSGPLLAVAHRPKSQAIVAGGLHNVYYIGSGEAEVEPPFLPVTRLRSIAGWVYATHLYRGVSVRRGAGRWESLAAGINVPAESEGHGFLDISGLSEDNLYAVGGRGDVWRWNGARWRRCHFPSNIYLRTVLCAGDGEVYITGQGGVVYVGGGDRWKRLGGGDFSLYFNDTVWYDGKVWLASDAGLYSLDHQGSVQPVDLPPALHVTTGYLSVGDGLMLSAGIGGVSVYDGNDWELIVNHVEMELAARSSGVGG